MIPVAFFLFLLVLISFGKKNGGKFFSISTSQPTVGVCHRFFFYLYGYRINLEKELALYLYALCESLKLYMIKSKYIKLWKSRNLANLHYLKDCFFHTKKAYLGTLMPMHFSFMTKFMILSQFDHPLLPQCRARPLEVQHILQ